MVKRKLILAAFIIVKLILQYSLISPVYELHRDEFLHLDQAKHLAWGYLSVPPFTSWISEIVLLLGNSVFWVKFFPALFGALTIVVVWKIIEELGGNLFALLLGSTSVLLSVLLRINILYQPNSFDILCWTSFYFIVIKYFKTGNYKWLYTGAVVFAVGFLNKYNLVFLLVGFAPAILFSKQRNIFLQKHFYGAILLALVLISPNIIWQYQNHFPVVHHMKELAATQLVNVKRYEFLLNQLMFFTGSLVVIIAALIGLIVYKPFRNYQSFFWAFVFTLAVFTYLKAKGYYAIGLYPVYIAFGSAYLSVVLKDGWKKYLQPVLLALPVLFFIPFYSIGFPNKSPEYILAHSKKYKDFGLLKWEDGKDHNLPQDFADMLGWKELAQKTDSAYAALAGKGKTLVLCDNYGQTGAINFYSKQNIKAVSFNADYINWFDLSERYENLIRIKEQKNVETELQKTSPYFQTSFIAGSVTNSNAREFGTTIFVFSGAKVDIRERIKREISEKKNAD